MRPDAVRARSVTKTFGKVIALDGVDLDVPTGQIHGLVGPNGAGKTTLLGLLLGLALPDSGGLEILGVEAQNVRSVVGGVTGFVDAPGLYPTLTARRNLSTLAALRGDRITTDADALLERVGLRDVADEPVRGFSLGMRQRLGLAAALLGDPQVLVLDEPANGLDPAGKRQVHGILTGLADDGRTVILSSHRMDDLAVLCDEVTLLSTGRVVFSGPLAKLARESGDLAYRVVTSDPLETARTARGVASLRPVRGAEGVPRGDDRGLVVRGPEEGINDLVIALVGDGIAIREIAPVVPPLEAAFLALTGAEVAVEPEVPAR